MNLIALLGAWWSLYVLLAVVADARVTVGVAIMSVPMLALSGRVLGWW